jgi:hypothetical integral membrane protein (TIGR02206 family)
MLIDIIIKPGEPLWFKMFFFTAIFIVGLLLISKYYPSQSDLLRKSIGVFLLTIAVSIHFYLIAQNQWTIQRSLPLQLCSLSGLLSGIVLLMPTQIGYEILMYWGIPGALHSLLTPELTQGSGNFILYEYYISHGGIILASLFLTFSTGMSVRKKSWWNIFLLTQILLPVIGMVNFFLNSNYMYLRQKPQADNILIIGQWPWYILFLEIFLLIHFYLVYLLFYKMRKINS